MEQLAKLKVKGEFYDTSIQPWQTILESISNELALTDHFDARTVEEASHLCRVYEYKRAKVIGGGTDILRMIKQKYLPELPEVLINIKTVPHLADIKEGNGILKIGALTRLSDIEASELVKAKYGVLAETASLVGSPQIRNMATIAGSICQDLSCWYYRAGKDYYHCWRKGGKNCPAKEGDNRWMFSIFPTPEGCECYGTCQSDMAITLSALGASIKTTQRTIPIEQFYTPTFPGHVLNPGEVITEVQVPALGPLAKAKYSKFSIRKSLDRPLVSVACVSREKETKIAIGGVSLIPYIADRVADLINGKKISEKLAEKAGQVAVKDAAPMSMNAWKVEVTKNLVKRTILALT